MKSTGFSKTTYPVVPKLNGSQRLDTNFRDDNLRDPLLNDKNILEDLSAGNSTLRQSSDTFDNLPKNNIYDKVPIDTRTVPGQLALGMSKSQTNLHSFQKAKKLKPIGSSRDTSSGFNQTNGFKADYGLSDFYLKNFLGKPNADVETRKISTVNQPNALENTTLRTSMDFRKRSPLKQISSDLAQISMGQLPKQKFYDTLPVSYKEYYMDKKDFMRIFDDIDIANFCLEEVVERLKCYRFELGNLLDKVGFSYKKIMEKMLDFTMKISSEKDLIHERKMEENFQGIKTLENEKKALEEKNKQYKNLSDVTESEANIYKFNVKSLQNEVSMLYELLKKDYLVQDRLEKQSDLQDIDELRPIKPKDIAEPSKLLAKNLLTLQESIKNLESEQNAKEERLQEMNNLLKAMLRGGKKEVSTQVDEGELAWAAKNILNQEGVKPKPSDFENHEASAVNIDTQINTQLTKDEIPEGVDPIHVLKFKEKMEKKQIEELSQVEPVKTTGGKNPPPLTIPPAGSQTQTDNWNLPLSVIVFLENVTKENKTANVLPWSFFKRIIYEIYQEKLSNALEIQNALVNTSMAMSEFLPLYFLKTYRLRRIAEMKLLEFGVSLKYHLKTWFRAATFANLCNITNMKLDKENPNPSNFPEFDIYAQNFYLYAFSKVAMDPANIYDHPDGTSYLAKEKIEEITNEILSFEHEINRKKVTTILARNYKTYTDNGREGEGVDVDRLLHMFMEVYFDVKNRNTQTLTKHFYKQQSSGEGVLSLDEILQMTGDIIDVESSVPGYMYPKELSVCRAFLYSLTSGKNSFSITYKEFINGIARFGIDCPFPFINVSGQSSNFNATGSLGFDDRSSTKKSLLPRKSKMIPQIGQKNTQNMKTIDSPKRGTEDEATVKLPAVGGEGGKDGKKKKDDEKGGSFKIDSASTLFAQHFSILRELKNYCNQLRDILSKEKDTEKVWKGFENIMNALDAGCQFLSYPVTM